MGSDWKEHIESGLLESFVMGLASIQEAAQVDSLRKAYPEVERELEAIESALEAYAQANGVQPPARLKARLMDQLSAGAKVLPFEGGNLPDLQVDANPARWQATVAHFPPPTLEPDSLQAFALQHAPDTETLLIYTNTRIKEEIHTRTLETFLVLEGSCNCVIEGEPNHMYAGDLMEIPLHVPHYIEITSPYPLKVILQKKRVA